MGSNGQQISVAYRLFRTPTAKRPKYKLDDKAAERSRNEMS